ncbi:hypothetical protein PG995_003388, partial [Apiospora arundinis]
RSTRHASEAQQAQQRQERSSSGRGAAKRGRSEITTATPTSSSNSNSNSIATTTSTRSSHPNLPQQSPSARMKRPLEIIDTNLDHPKSKRARIAVEILSRSIPPGISPPKSIAVRPQTAAKPATVATTQRKLHHQRQQQTPLLPTRNLRPPLPPLPINRLQPNAADTTQPPKEQQGGRKLRSQEQTRFKSELSAYFPDYDEVIGNDAKEQHVLNVDTPIVIIDTNTTPDAPPHGVRILPSRHAAHHHAGPASTTAKTASQSYGDDLYTNLFESEIVGDALHQEDVDDDNEDDPLADEHYEAAHRRAERLEKSIRNTERGRAQHERDQIVRLLNDLQGHDWLRTMGVNGVTESRKKTFEPARDHFIHGCQSILEKFRHWTLEEKRLKLERERALAEREAGSEGSEEPSELEEDEDEVEDSDQDDEMISADSDREIADSVSDGDPPDHSDVDASIAKQLHEEALARTKYTASTGARRSRTDLPPHAPEFYEPPREFTSFFTKRHEREASLRKSRRGRTVMAWGHPIPEVEEDDFDLTEEYRDEDYMKSRARRKRRDKRGRRV